MRIAGSYVAWLDAPGGGGDRITVADRASGAVIATYPATSGSRSWAVFDIDEQGNLVAVQGNRLVAFSLAAPRPRVLATRLWGSSVSIAAGRVAYISADADSGPGPARARRPGGQVLKRLDRYGKRRWPAGRGRAHGPVGGVERQARHLRRTHRPRQRIPEEAVVD